MPVAIVTAAGLFGSFHLRLSLPVVNKSLLQQPNFVTVRMYSMVLCAVTSYSLLYGFCGFGEHAAAIFRVDAGSMFHRPDCAVRKLIRPESQDATVIRAFTRVFRTLWTVAYRCLHEHALKLDG
jgi:hypothetical protein